MKKIILILGIIAVATSCQKEYDNPPSPIPAEGSSISLDSLIKLYQGAPVKFDKHIFVDAVVTMDESDGNLYKNVYIQDADKAVNMRLLSAGGLYVGDSIRIDLMNTRLSTYNGVLQLDSVNVDQNVTKQAVDRDLTPLTVNVTDVNTNLQSRLVRLENVQFTIPQLDLTYADAETNESRDVFVEDCDGNTVLFRNSGYASFANEKLAQGNGTITAIVGVYNGTVQLLIRSFDEIQMNGPRCEGQVWVKNFDDALITTDGWHVEQVTGDDSWETNDQGASSYYCQISNYNGSGNNPCESWLISPAMDLNSVESPKLKFLNASNYNGPNLQVYASTDYSGTGDPNAANWVNLNPTLSTGGWSWVSSGLLDLSSVLGPNVHIGFKYTGTASDGKTWEIDDIIIVGKLK